MEMSHEPHGNIFNLIVTVILVAAGHAFDWFKSNDPLIEFITWLGQMGAWGSAWVIGAITFLNFLHNHSWINLKRKKK